MNRRLVADILLVEDFPEDREFSIRAFKKHNLATHLAIAKDGEEALDILFCRSDHEGREPGV